MNTASHPSLRNPPDLPVLGADRFEIQERIGAGGMGTVYKAVQKSVGRLVAVKVLSSEYASNAAGVARFVREATVVSRLVHPNIVSMIEFGRDPEGNLLLVMELLEGEPLRQTLRRERRLPPWRAVQVAMQVLAALRVAHAAGVVHRDLKPENIFITNVDGADHAKVLDFGVAKMLSHEVGNETTAGSLVGTLKYMAPEQIAGDPPDARVDLYALGVLLYEMLGGALPYEHKERVALLRAILNDPPVPLSRRAPEVPAALADVVMRAISKLTIDRFQSAEEFRAALAPFAMVGPDARPPPFPITQEIRLPIRAPSTDRDNSTRAGSPNAISSASAKVPAVNSDPSGAKSLQAPPADAGSISFSTSGAMLSSGVLVPSPVSIPSQHDALNYTTGAGLSAATHRSHVVAPKRSIGLALVLGGLGIALVAGSAGVIAARGAAGRGSSVTDGRSSSGPAQGTQGTQSTQGAQGTQGTQGTQQTNDSNHGAPAGGHVMVRTTPAGAEVRDATSNEVLCTQTPCMVPVTGAQTRRVRLTLGAMSMEAVLDSSVATMSVPLGEAGPTAGPTIAVNDPVNGAASAASDAGARRPVNSGRLINRRPRTNETYNNGGNDIPLFGSRPGG